MIESKDNVKYMGAVLDQRLTGESIASQVLQKANVKLKFYIVNRSFLICIQKKSF